MRVVAIDELGTLNPRIWTMRSTSSACLKGVDRIGEEIGFTGAGGLCATCAGLEVRGPQAP